MEPGLESAVLAALARAEAGADVSADWLKRSHPRWWREVRDFLRVHEGLRAGRPSVERVGPFRVRQRLGEGGMGTVYLAEDTDSGGALVALKVLHPHLLSQPRFLERALREARLGAEIVHENIVRTQDVGVVAGPPADLLYLVTEYVDGQNLRGLLDELGAVPEDLCRHIAREVLRALAAIHAAGAVHRDLKPENVLLSRDGRVKVTDLGAAHALAPGEAITRSGEFLGSLPYAAPEQLLRAASRTDGRSDLYALGVMLHELASGAHPFLDAAEDGARDRLVSTPRLGAGVSGGTLSAFFRAFVATLLAHEPRARFQSAAAALDALEGDEGSAWWREAQASARDAAAPAAPSAHAFAGRKGELAKVRAAFTEAAAGRGRIVFVEGEAGAGKSRLVEETFARLARDGVAIHRLVARFHPGAAPGDAAEPWISALRESAAVGDAAATPLSGLRSLAYEKPVVLLVEDLHFADAGARRELAVLARALADERVLVLVTSRPDEQGAAQLLALPHAERIPLARLAPREVRALVAGMLGDVAAVDGVLAVVQRRSDGLPFFAVELVRHLCDNGVLVRDADGAWDVAGDPGRAALPATLRAMVEERLAGLSPDDLLLLRFAARAGFVFDPELVADAAGRTTLDVLRTLARIERRHRLVRSVGARCTFDHHVIQETLVSSVDEAAAREHHGSLADALERRALASRGEVRPETALAIFDHFVRADKGARAARWLSGALRRLEATCCAAEAAELIQRAMDTRDAVPHERLAEALLELSAYLDILCRREEEIAVLRRAVALAEEAGVAATVARAHAELGRCLGRLGRGREALDEGLLAIAAAGGDQASAEYAHSVTGHALVSMGRVEEGVAHHVRRLELARSLGDVELESDAEDAIGTAREFAGDVERAATHLRRSLDLVRRMPVAPPYPGLLRMRLACCLMITGRFDEVPALLDEQARLSHRIGDLQGETWAQLASARVLERAGRWDEAIATARRGAAAAPQCNDPPFEAMALRTAAWTLFRAGRSAEALELSRAGRVLGERLASGPPILLCRALDAEVFSSLGAHEDAVASATAAVEMAETIPQARGRRLALLARARCAFEGRGDPELLRRALQMTRDEGDAWGATRVLVELGLALTEAEDRDGTDVLLEALAAGRAQSAPEVTAPAVARLAALGAIPADAARDECALLAPALPVRARLAVEHDLWRATEDPSHLDEARRQLAVLRAWAPASCAETIVARVPIHRAVSGASES